VFVGFAVSRSFDMTVAAVGVSTGVIQTLDLTVCTSAGRGKEDDESGRGTRVAEDKRSSRLDR